MRKRRHNSILETEALEAAPRMWEQSLQMAALEGPSFPASPDSGSKALKVDP